VALMGNLWRLVEWDLFTGHLLLVCLVFDQFMFYGCCTNTVFFRAVTLLVGR